MAYFAPRLVGLTRLSAERRMWGGAAGWRYLAAALLRSWRSDAGAMGRSDYGAHADCYLGVVGVDERCTRGSAGLLPKIQREVAEVSKRGSLHWLRHEPGKVENAAEDEGVEQMGDFPRRHLDGLHEVGEHEVEDDDGLAFSCGDGDWSGVHLGDARDEIGTAPFNDEVDRGEHVCKCWSSVS